jgi:flagellar hook-basal body complex protein FliE
MDFIMNIGLLQGNLINLRDPDSVRAAATSAASGNPIPMPDFSAVFSTTKETATVADRVTKTSATELLTGQTDDLAGLMIDIQRAELSLNLAIQIRNRLVDAYTELMRMQV